MSRPKVGLVTSRFNEEITSKLEEGALSYLENYDVEILSVRVPGAVEIPLACKALFELGCEGVVAVGAVIRGETTHYETVCNSVERGVTHLILETGMPIGFGVIMTENDEQAEARAGGAHGNKGADAAQVVIEMMGLLKEMKAMKASDLDVDPAGMLVTKKARTADMKKSAAKKTAKAKTKKKK